MIHAGLYYGHDTLKTNLCIQGKQMLYDLCNKHDIPHMNCGKWVVAQTDDQMDVDGDREENAGSEKGA